MGQRRKHVLQSAFSQEVQPPADHQQIVRAVGARGGNIIEVEYPNGSTTLCMMPARFNRKLWVRRGGYLIIEPSPEAEQDANSRVTGTICTVLYDEHIKQLKKLPGVWPPEFTSTNQSTATTADDFMPQTDSEGGDSESDAELNQPEAGSSAAAGSQSSQQQQQQQQQQQRQQQNPNSTQHIAGPEAVTQTGHITDGAPLSSRQQLDDEDSSESDDDLPPLQQINNRRVVQYEVSDDSDSDEED